MIQKNTKLCQIVHSTKKTEHNRKQLMVCLHHRNELAQQIPNCRQQIWSKLQQLIQSLSFFSSLFYNKLQTPFVSTLPEITCSPSDATYDSVAVILTQIEILPPQNETPDRNETARITSQNSITEENM